jgi:hypothetical protein
VLGTTASFLFDDSASEGHFEVVEFLAEHYPAEMTPVAITAAAQFGSS